MRWNDITSYSPEWECLYDVTDDEGDEYSGLMVGVQKEDKRWVYTYRKIWWNPLPGVSTLEEAQAAAYMLYKMR
jgi:hypothetical protein